jgi:hypothetical protein
MWMWMCALSMCMCSHQRLGAPQPHTSLDEGLYDGSRVNVSLGVVCLHCIHGGLYHLLEHPRHTYHDDEHTEYSEREFGTCLLLCLRRLLHML